MTALLRKVGTITEKGQVTIPKSIRDALGLEYGGRIAFCVDENRHVSIERDDQSDSDPVIDSFLAFLAKDMEKTPERISQFPEALRGRMENLVQGMQADLDDPIVGDVDI